MRPRPRPLLLACLLAAACADPAALTARAVRDLGPLPTNPAIRGRDGGYSALVAGRSVWLYGDTILAAPGEDGSSWRNNTWSWTLDTAAADGLNGFAEPLDAQGAPLEFFPVTADEADFNQRHAGDPCQEAPCGARRVLWPGPLVPLEDGRALAFYLKIHGEPGEWNFSSLGCGVALWDGTDAPPTRPEVRPGHAEPTLLWPADAEFCPSAALLEGDHLYAWSCIENPGKPCHLARVPPADALDPAAWRYWDGDAWAPDRADAAPVFRGNDMASVHRSPHFGLLLAIYSRPLDREIVLRTAERPEGPWSREERLFLALEAPSGDAPYSGMAHPEQSDGPREFISYHRGTGDWQGELRLVEVTLAAP